MNDKKSEKVNNLFSSDDNLRPEISEKKDLNKSENKVLTMPDVEKAIENAQEEKPKRKRRAGQGRKSNAQIEEEKKAADLKKILKGSFAYALIGLTNSIALLLHDKKWSITDQKEGEFLAEATIQYLDERFPEWEKASPELNLVMAWSSYFIKRVMPVPETNEFAKEFNKVPGTKKG